MAGSNIEPLSGKWYVVESYKVKRVPPADLSEEERDDMHQHNRSIYSMIIVGPFETSEAAGAELLKHTDAYMPRVWRCPSGE